MRAKAFMAGALGAIGMVGVMLIAVAVTISGRFDPWLAGPLVIHAMCLLGAWLLWRDAA